MSVDAKAVEKGHKSCRSAKLLKAMFGFAGLLAITYGGLYRVQTSAWPWENWGGFASFSSATTKDAFQRGKRFTREKVVPATHDLLARAERLLEKWETESPENGGKGAADREGKGAMEIAPESLGGKGAGRTASDRAAEITQAESLVTMDGKETTIKMGDPNHLSPTDARAVTEAAKLQLGARAQAREKFKEALRHYQRSSPEMQGNQAQLQEARAKFEEALALFEKAKAENPNDPRIEDDLQEVQVFLYDCQKRLKVGQY